MTKREKIESVVNSANQQIPHSHISYKKEPKMDAPAPRMKEKNFAIIPQECKEVSYKKLPKKNGAPMMWEKKYVIDTTVDDERCILNKK